MRVRNDDAVSRSLLSLPDMAGSGGVMMARIQSSVISRHQFSQPVQQQVIIGKFHVGRGQYGNSMGCTGVRELCLRGGPSQLAKACFKAPKRQLFSK